MKPQIISTKAQYYRLAQQGLAGNSPKVWSSAEIFLREADDDRVGIRVVKAASKAFRAFVSREDLLGKVASLGLRTGDYIISRVLDLEHIRISGELSISGGDWIFYHSYQKAPMRQALTESGMHAYGMKVWHILKGYCNPVDIEDLHELFDRFSPNHQYPVIELTATTIAPGIFAGRNTLIWEIRHY